MGPWDLPIAKKRSLAFPLGVGRGGIPAGLVLGRGGSFPITTSSPHGQGREPEAQGTTPNARPGAGHAVVLGKYSLPFAPCGKPVVTYGVTLVWGRPLQPGACGLQSRAGPPADNGDSVIALEIL